MTETLTEREIDEQIELRRQRFEHVVQDIRHLLRQDLENFVVRETRKVFLSQPDVAGAMSPEAILALRREAQAVGKAEAEAAVTKLGDIALWWTGEKLPRRDGDKSRDLSEVTAVWEAIHGVEAAFVAFMGRHGFRIDSAPVYKAPAFFVGGRYMPGLNEHYWRILDEIRELHEQRVALAERVTRERLQALWDAAEQG
jgi:hypothetical protein